MPVRTFGRATLWSLVFTAVGLLFSGAAPSAESQPYGNVKCIIQMSNWGLVLRHVNLAG